MSKRFGYLFADEMEYKPFRELALKNGGAEVPDAPLPLVRYDVDGAEIFAVQSGLCRHLFSPGEKGGRSAECRPLRCHLPSPQGGRDRR